MSKETKRLEHVALPLFMDALWKTLCKTGYECAVAMARQCLRDNPTRHEFVMAMGGYFFTDSQKNPIHDEKPVTTSDKMLADFIAKWDQHIGMTGMPVRFTVDGEERHDW